MSPALARRLLAEFVGTGLLVAVVVGSGIAASQLTSDGALRLLVNSLVTAMGLAVLILALSPASGAQFNPVVTGADWALRRRTSDRYPVGHAAAVIAVQVIGAVAGAALADAMFGKAVLSVSGTQRNGPALLLSEIVATAGLLFIIVALARTDRTQHACWAVGAWIGAAYWFTASTSFANPAVTIARALTNSFSGIAPADVPMFIVAQFAGALAGLGVMSWFFTSGAPERLAAWDRT
jgi:glycerol uptake facilitator-like aquaporin